MLPTFDVHFARCCIWLCNIIRSGNIQKLEGHFSFPIYLYLQEEYLDALFSLSHFIISFTTTITVRTWTLHYALPGGWEGSNKLIQDSNIQNTLIQDYKYLTIVFLENHVFSDIYSLLKFLQIVEPIEY